MSLNKSLFRPQAFERPAGLSWETPAEALEKWANGPQVFAAEGEAIISIFDVIGHDPWSGGGVTTAGVAEALRAIGKRDVTVKINSPGGDVFEGLAIYNLLAEHPAKVTVDVLGIAASAASVIAEAGDIINMGLGAFLMIHNAWGVVVGDTRDMSAAAATLGAIDGALADIYVARSGQPKDDVKTMMDAETYLSAKDAVDKGFADAISDRTDAGQDAGAPVQNRSIKARRQVEAGLARMGYTRAERSELISQLNGGERDAAPMAERDAGLIAALEQLQQTLRS